MRFLSVQPTSFLKEDTCCRTNYSKPGNRWYFGGIYGAGLAAKEYNKSLFECSAEETKIENKLFPILMIQTTF